LWNVEQIGVSVHESGSKYRVRWRDFDSRNRSRTFDRKKDAETFDRGMRELSAALRKTCPPPDFAAWFQELLEELHPGQRFRVEMTTDGVPLGRTGSITWGPGEPLAVERFRHELASILEQRQRA
jgi:hypothetical protein